MARLKWVAASMHAWAAWREGYGKLYAARIDGVPSSRRMENWMPKESTSVRRTEEALRMLDEDDREVLGLVYVAGPRAHKKSVSEIARWVGVADATFRARLWRAEARLAEKIDSLEFATGGA